MKPINSPRDFEVMLGAERAVVFVYFAWSGQAVLSQRAVAAWEEQSRGNSGNLHYNIYELAPDNHPFSWKWVACNREHGYGSVVWIIKGATVAYLPNAAQAGTKTLTRITNDCFTLGKAYTRESIAMLQSEPAPFDLELLKILCCPETHQALALADAAILDKVNERFIAGRLQNRAGQSVRDKIEDGLVRADGRYLYPMRRNIPVLLVDEAIPLP